MILQKLRRLPSDLIDAEWEFLRSFLPPQKQRGRHRADDRATLNGILYALSTGCRWRDVPPERYGSGITCWRRLRLWQENGTWERIAVNLLRELKRKGKLNLRSGYLDASIREAKRGQKVQRDIPRNIGKTA